MTKKLLTAGRDKIFIFSKSTRAHRVSYSVGYWEDFPQRLMWPMCQAEHWTPSNARVYLYSPTYPHGVHKGSFTLQNLWALMRKISKEYAQSIPWISVSGWVLSWSFYHIQSSYAVQCLCKVRSGSLCEHFFLDNTSFTHHSLETVVPYNVTLLAQLLHHSGKWRRPSIPTVVI